MENKNKETYQVSALKYRPKSFDEVVGQETITKTLKYAVENDKLPQALLFSGPRGVGKTSCARILAKVINSTKDNNDDYDFSFNIFELDAASNNHVDDIKSLNEQVRIPPQNGNYKVFIIDEVHMLSSSAFNAFLKTLEEPPKHAIFILATTEKQKIALTCLPWCGPPGPSSGTESGPPGLSSACARRTVGCAVDRPLQMQTSISGQPSPCKRFM